MSPKHAGTKLIPASKRTRRGYANLHQDFNSWFRKRTQFWVQNPRTQFRYRVRCSRKEFSFNPAELALKLDPFSGPRIGSVFRAQESNLRCQFWSAAFQIFRVTGVALNLASIKFFSRPGLLVRWRTYIAMKNDTARDLAGRNQTASETQSRQAY